MSDTHEPVQWLNYAGDVRGQLGRVMGPTLERPDQMLTVVTEDYDPKADRTRLGLTYGIVEVAP